MNVSHSVFYCLMSMLCVLLLHNFLSVINYDVQELSH